MKQKDFKKYDNYNLCEIRNNLIAQSINKLPIEIKNFVNKTNPIVGNEYTRIMRCISLIDHEIIDRFLLEHELTKINEL